MKRSAPLKLDLKANILPVIVTNHITTIAVELVRADLQISYLCHLTLLALGIGEWREDSGSMSNIASSSSRSSH
jgi:hypothetical protein